VSDLAKDLILKLITKPERRLTAEEALQHEWIRKQNQNKAGIMSGQRLNKINVESLKKFQHHQKLKQIALTAIAIHLSAKDIAHLKEVFKSLDHNGDGNLNLEELREGITEMRNSNELIELLSGADTDKNGTINYTG
jgi:calcium-dependent protein kinase